MNSEKRKTPKPHILVLNLLINYTEEQPEKLLLPRNVSIYYTWENIKSSYNNNKPKISAPTWNDEFELPDGSYSVSDIQDYFEYVF